LATLARRERDNEMDTNIIGKRKRENEKEKERERMRQ
jgi:hypothetical protein